MWEPTLDTKQRSGRKLFLDVLCLGASSKYPKSPGQSRKGSRWSGGGERRDGRADGQEERGVCSAGTEWETGKRGFCTGAEWGAVHNGTRGIYMRSSVQRCRRAAQAGLEAVRFSHAVSGSVQWATTVKPRSRGILAGPFLDGAVGCRGQEPKFAKERASCLWGGGTPAGMVDC